MDESFDWEDDRPPRIPWTETVIYETHVKGLTKQLPQLPADYATRYADTVVQCVVDGLRHR